MQPTRRRALLLPLVCALLVACGDGAPHARRPQGELAPWEGPLRALFDDSIDPTAVGMSLGGGTPPAESRSLRLRVQAAEIAARMRVQTITRDTAGARKTYILNLQVGVPTLMPAKFEQRNLELVIGPDDPAFGLVRSLETTMRGRTFIGFVRRFAGVEGPVLHWYLTADSAEVARVVHEYAVLEELAGQ